MPLYIYGQTEFASIFISLLHINVHFMFDIAQYGASLMCLHILCLSTNYIQRHSIVEFRCWRVSNPDFRTIAGKFEVRTPPTNGFLTIECL